MRHLIVSLIIWLSAGHGILLAQDCCDTDSRLIICHTPASEFCYPNTSVFDFDCDYTLDGEAMIGINAKLRNPNNFGATGVSPCAVQLQGLRRSDMSTERLSELGCDIIILGAFATEEPSTIEPEYIDTVKRWSVLCEENLVIAFQKESESWGYRIDNNNSNPNRPGETSGINIFDGPFGSLSEFNQGGTFQAHYRSIPVTGASILARDRNGRPTIVLDSETNDLLLADVGIICSGGAGRVSDNGNVINSNDILACNIMALGCELANVGSTTEESIVKCPDDEYELPDGDTVVDEGVYLTALLNQAGCDSTIITNVTFSENPVTLIEYTGCEGDDYSVSINDQNYNQDRPVGEEILTDQYGCDSLVMVDLTFYSNTESTTQITKCPNQAYTLPDGTEAFAEDVYASVITNAQNCDSVITTEIIWTEVPISEAYYQTCEGSGFEVKLGDQTFDENYNQGEAILTDADGCDSLVQVNIEVLSNSSESLTREVCAGDFFDYNGYTLISPVDTSIILTNALGCDSTIFLSLLDPDIDYVDIQTSVELDYGGEYMFDNEVPDSYTVLWEPSTGLSCPDCPNPIIKGNEGVAKYNLSVVSDKNCTYQYSIDVSYICNPYFANVFNPNDTGPNARFGIQSNCEVENYTVDIYDRYGSVVFSTQDVNTPWDGTRQGKALAQGVYVYYAYYETNGEQRQTSGSITLIR